MNVSIEPNLVIDIIKYLDVTVETIAKLDETSRQIIIERDRKTYSDGIEKKIEDAGHFTGNSECLKGAEWGNIQFDDRSGQNDERHGKG